MKAIAQMRSDTGQTMKLEWLYKVGPECELNSIRASERNSVVVGSNKT